MNNDSRHQIAIFTQAVKLPIHERAAFLDRVCLGNTKLRRKLEALLSASERAGDFLEEPAIRTGSAGILPAIPAALGSLLREAPVPAKPRRRRNSKNSFQDRRKKRRGE